MSSIPFGVGVDLFITMCFILCCAVWLLRRDRRGAAHKKSPLAYNICIRDYAPGVEDIGDGPTIGANIQEHLIDRGFVSRSDRTSLRIYINSNMLGSEAAAIRKITILMVYDEKILCYSSLEWDADSNSSEIALHCRHVAEIVEVFLCNYTQQTADHGIVMVTEEAA